MTTYEQLAREYVTTKMVTGEHYSSLYIERATETVVKLQEHLTNLRDIVDALVNDPASLEADLAEAQRLLSQVTSLHYSLGVLAAVEQAQVTLYRRAANELATLQDTIGVALQIHPTNPPLDDGRASGR